MTPIQLNRVIEALAVLSLPFAVWFVLWLASQRWAVRQRRTLAFMVAARWIAIALAVVFLLIHETYGNFPSLYWAGCLAFSASLTWPERWVRRGIAPDLPPQMGAPEGWWPSKPL